jgi:hypothetical protein
MLVWLTEEHNEPAVLFLLRSHQSRIMYSYVLQTLKFVPIISKEVHCLRVSAHDLDVHISTPPYIRPLTRKARLLHFSIPHTGT